MLPLCIKKQKIMDRHAIAIWEGSGKEGKGNLSTQSGVLKNTQYAFKSRFEEGTGTNPEELIAAAHAGCFTMKLSFLLDERGYTANKIETKCDITFADGKITKSHLKVKASVPAIENNMFQEAVKEAEKTCPISVLLNTEISSEAILEG